MIISIPNKIQRAFAKGIRSLGLSPDSLSLRSALTRCRQRGHEIGTIIDVGASNGSWSMVARDFFPDARFFLVDALGIHEPALKKLKERHAGIDYTISAVGDRDGEIYFDSSDPFGGLASHTSIDKNFIKMPMLSIDTLVREKKLPPPFLLKLDTHGFEIPIFEGARATLLQTELIVVETYNFKLTSSSLRFHEMCAWFETRGFRCIDLCDPMHRPLDGAFWQVDLFFIPSENMAFESNSYE